MSILVLTLYGHSSDETLLQPTPLTILDPVSADVNFTCFLSFNFPASVLYVFANTSFEEDLKYF